MHKEFVIAFVLFLFFVTLLFGSVYSDIQNRTEKLDTAKETCEKSGGLYIYQREIMERVCVKKSFLCGEKGPYICQEGIGPR